MTNRVTGMTRCVGAAFIPCEIFLFLPAVNVGEYRAGDVVPYGEDGAGDGRHRKRRKCSRSKACGKSGVLHADFDGERLRFGCREF